MQKPAIRTCIGTKEKLEKKLMWRFVILDGQLVFDSEQRMNGRGYYLCQDSKLLKKKYSIKRKVYKIASEEIDKILLGSS